MDTATHPPTNDGWIRRLSSSKFNYYFGYVANFTLVFWLLSRGFANGQSQLSAPMWGIVAVSGLLLWTLSEYVLHKWLYHDVPSPLQTGHLLRSRAVLQSVGDGRGDGVRVAWLHRLLRDASSAAPCALEFRVVRVPAAAPPASSRQRQRELGHHDRPLGPRVPHQGLARSRALVTASAPITEIAFASGFGNVSHELYERIGS